MPAFGTMLAARRVDAGCTRARAGRASPTMPDAREGARRVRMRSHFRMPSQARAAPRKWLWMGRLVPLCRQVVSLCSFSADPKLPLQGARCAVHAARRHRSSAALTCARASRSQASAFAFAAAEAALAHDGAARRATRRCDLFWAACDLPRCQWQKCVELVGDVVCVSGGLCACSRVF